MSSLLVGTASWTDKSLLDSGRFYPPSVQSAEERLRFYASQFPLVEVDSSYYAIPLPRAAELWSARTPAGFVFNVKAFRLFTGHQTPPAALPPDIRRELSPSPDLFDERDPSADRDVAPARDRNIYYKDLPEELAGEMWKRFRAALEPLRRTGKLGLVHFQFSPWVIAGSRSQQHIERCVEEMHGFRLAAEFRHRSWFDGERIDDTLAFERAHGLVNTVVDEPAGFANTIPSVWEATRDDIALVRLHGRNRATWNLKGLASSAQRFNYDYAQEELEALAGPVVELSGKVDTTHVIFNNNFEDQGMRNARALSEILRRRALRPENRGDASADPR
jgi:uncharacterized protein YecE (DUF72 family)